MKQLGELKVSEYMTEQVTVVKETALLVEAIRLMDEHRLSVVPVVNETGQLAGILSNRDLIEMIHEFQSDLGILSQVREETREFFIRVLMHQGDNTLVRDVMTSPVESISSESNLVAAAQILSAREFHHLPVLDDSNNTIGIISTSDFVRAIADCGALATSHQCE